MNAKARTARQICKARRSAAKDHAQGLHTLAGHGRLAGLNESDATGVGGALRAKGKLLCVKGRAAVMVRPTSNGAVPVKGARRYTVAEFATLLAAYKPRVARFVAARDALIKYSGA